MTGFGQCALDVIPGTVERGGRPNECHIILLPDPREPVRRHGVRLGEGVLQPEHEHDLHGTRGLQASSRRAVNDPAVTASLLEPSVTRVPLCRTNCSKLRASTSRRFQAR